jgi:hypothetical protein
MVQCAEAAQNLPLESRRSLSQIIGEIGAGKLAIIASCALSGTVTGNAIYDFIIEARATYAFIQKTQPSASYLKATRLPQVEHNLVQQATWDFYEAYDEAAIPKLLTKADQCWITYDTSPSWSQFDYCVGYDMVLRSYTSTGQVEAHAQQSAYPSLANRESESFFIGKAEPLGGELAVVERVNHITLTIQNDNR